MAANMGFRGKAWAVAVLLALIHAVPSHAQAARSTAGPSACNQALHRFLPGDFNYCVGVHELERGRAGHAVEMFRLAAGWGDKRAQYLLGALHFNGDAVPADRARGLAWLELAAERDVALYRQGLALARRQASAEERREAATWVARLRPDYADATALARAERHYARAVRPLERLQHTGGTVCLVGIGAIAIAGEGVGDRMCPSATAVMRQLDATAAAYFAPERATGEVRVEPLRALEPDAP